jgi:hypothetical protein
MKSILTEARFQFLAGIITENEYNVILKESEILDKILDKISTQGIGSLSSDEKKYLDKYSKGDVSDEEQDVDDEEQYSPYGDWEFQLVIEPGYLGDDEENEAIHVYINWYDKEGEDDILNIDEHPDPKVVALQKYLKHDLWTLNPLKEYPGFEDFTFEEITYIGPDGNARYLGARVFEFDNVSELEDFLKNKYMEVFQTLYGK